MGLSTNAKGLSDKDGYECGYITFMAFRVRLAKTYNKKFGELYEKWMYSGLDCEELKLINKLLNDNDIWLLLNHSDCDGKFTHQECRKVYNSIKDLKMDMVGHNYGIMENYNMLEQWKNIFKHCYIRRVNLYFI